MKLAAEVASARPWSVLSPAALAAVALWGGSFVAVRLALPALPPFVLVAARLVLGASVLALLLRARRQRLFPRGRSLAITLGLGALFGAHVSIQAHGLAHTSAIHVGWLIGFSPVTIALFATLLLGERLRALGWLGIGVATAGVLVVTLEELPDFAGARLGDLLALSSCLTWTLYTLVAAPIVKREGPLRVSFTAMLAGALVVLPAALADLATARRPDSVELAALLFLGVGCSGFASLLWLIGQDRDGPARAGAMLYFEPFVTLGLAVVLLEESVGWRAALGGTLVLGGVLLLGRGVVRRGAAGGD